MPVLVTSDLSINSADTLSGYGAGAKVYWYSAATETGSYSLLSSTAIVSGTEEYEYWDVSGASTTWYKVRVGNSGATIFSDYSTAFQVMADSWTTLERVKVRTSVSDDTDDGILQPFLDAANAEMTRQVGIFLGPSSDTSRTYDGYAAVRSVPPSAGWGTRLWIPGGIRTCTLLEIAPQTAAAFETIPATDYRLGPRSSELRVGQPYAYIEFLDITSGTRRYFPPGYDNVRPTGTFGYASTPAELQDMATALVARMWKARDQGADSAYPFLTAPEIWKLENYRHENGVSM